MSFEGEIPTAQSLTYFDIWGYTAITIEFSLLYTFMKILF
jgi:hypothetical protein